MWRGRGKCFACQGKGGKTFKTSPAERAKGRIQAAARELRRQNANAAEFAKEFPAETAWMTLYFNL